MGIVVYDPHEFYEIIQRYESYFEGDKNALLRTIDSIDKINNQSSEVGLKIENILILWESGNTVSDEDISDMKSSLYKFGASIFEGEKNKDSINMLPNNIYNFIKIFEGYEHRISDLESRIHNKG